MQSKLIVLFFFAILFVQGCIPSLHPLYTAKDTVLHQALKDKVYQNKSSEWHFQEVSEQKKYLLNYIENDVVAQFQVHLVQLGDHLFFDFYPTKDSNAIRDQKAKGKEVAGEVSNGFFEMHKMPVHSFAKVKFTEDGIVIKQFDSDWLDKLFRERRIRIKHEITEHGIVLTASTKELQKFILKYAEEEQAYSDPILLKRS